MEKQKKLFPSALFFFLIVLKNLDTKKLKLLSLINLN